MMNRIIASLLIIAIAGIFAAITPSSEQSVNIPDFENDQILDALVNDDFGVIVGLGDNGVELATFTVGSNFDLGNASATVNNCQSPQLINAGDDVDTFLVFCNVAGNGSSSGSVNFQSYQIESDGSLSYVNSSDYSAEGQVMISASAFVTKQGNVYMADSSDGMIAIVEFQVSSQTYNVRFQNILDNFENASGMWFIQDLHSLPFDAGVSVILTSQQNNQQLFLSAYFNGSVFTNQIPEGQFLQYVGRHRGSSFGYTIGVETQNTPYTVVTAWDLSDRTVSNSVQIKGQVTRRNDGHFSTNEMVFVYTESSDTGYIYELPYSERGFLPNSVNFAQVDALASGNLVDGEDGTHIYSFTTTDSETAQLSRWTF